MQAHGEPRPNRDSAAPGSNELSALVVADAGTVDYMPHFNGFRWSGREDSNLRPLPPEDAAPDRFPRNSVVPDGGAFASVATSFPPRSSSRFKPNLRPLSSGEIVLTGLPLSIWILDRLSGENRPMVPGLLAAAIAAEVVNADPR